MRRLLILLSASGFIIIMFFGIFFATEKMHYFTTETSFVILMDKVGDPALMTTFRVDPKGPEQKNPKYCHVGGDKLYTQFNISVFTAAQVGDVLRRYHYTDSYQIFGKTILQDCWETYMPIKLVSLYPDMNYWPFRKDDLKPGDPDYDRITKLTRSQQ